MGTPRRAADPRKAGQAQDSKRTFTKGAHCESPFRKRGSFYEVGKVKQESEELRRGAEEGDSVVG